MYDIVSSFYTYDDLGLNSYQTAVMAYIDDIPGMFEIVILLFAVCVPIFGKRAKFYYILAKITHVVVYVLLSYTSMSYYRLMFYGFWASWGSGLSGAVTDYLYVQRSMREPLGVRSRYDFRQNCILALHILLCNCIYPCLV